MERRIVLASASPRRRQLLAALGLVAEVIPADIDEEALQAPTPGALVEELARAKARAVAQRVREGLIIAADTTVYIDGMVLGKPRDEAEALTMLERLNGRTHEVFSGVAVLAQPEGICRSGHERTAVTFRRLRRRQLERYVATGEPMDKAGAYGIQERGAALVCRVEGCYFNVVGLPVALLAELLASFGVEVP